MHIDISEVGLDDVLPHDKLGYGIVIKVTEAPSITVRYKKKTVTYDEKRFNKEFGALDENYR